MEVIECIEQNDYVKFFETLDRKTYVQACLLSLYVNRVRSVAVKLFLKSKVRTSLEEFTNILMFDDQDRA